MTNNVVKILLLLFCTLYITEWRWDADYRIYLTDWKSQDTSNGMFDNCEVTMFRSQSDYKVFLTSNRSDANVIVYKGDFL